jgi:hypothetical protein
MPSQCHHYSDEHPLCILFIRRYHPALSPPQKRKFQLLINETDGIYLTYRQTDQNGIKLPNNEPYMLIQRGADAKLAITV